MMNFVILRPFAGDIQAGGFFFVSEQAPGVSLCRSLVRIFLADADGTGTRMLKKE